MDRTFTTSFLSRAAITLLLAVVTTATAWAQVQVWDYQQLEDAISSPTADEIIELGCDIDMGSNTITINKSININLMGYQIYGSSDGGLIEVESGCTLTFLSAGGAISNSGNGGAIVNNGTLTFDGNVTLIGGLTNDGTVNAAATVEKDGNTYCLAVAFVLPGYILEAETATITLFKDGTTVASIDISSSANITLNLNGHTLSSEDPYVFNFYEDAGTLTIASGGCIAGAITGSGTVKIADGLYLWNGSELLSGTVSDVSKVCNKTLTPNPADFEQNGENEFTIHTAEGWGVFCDLLAGGSSFSGKTVKLGADISVTTMAGTEGHRFKGHFDGRGKTLTLSYGSADAPFNENYCAPFRYIEGADIHDLTVAGTILTQKQYAAGIAANVLNNNAITDCRSSVTINSLVSGDGTHGGFVANCQNNTDNETTVTFTRCAFDGKLLGSTTNNCGGFVGWTEGNDRAGVKFIDCLFAPIEVSIQSDGCATFSRGRDNNRDCITVEKSYYTQTLGTKQGETAYVTPPADVITEPLTIAGVTVYVKKTMLTDITATAITANTATISWTGFGDSYNVRYGKGGQAKVTLSVPADIWGDDSGYQMLLDADHNTYGTVFLETGGLTTSGDAPDGLYANFEYKIPEDADGKLDTKNVVDGINTTELTITIPAGIYDWCITNPSPNDRVWIASENGNVGGRQNDFVFEAGKHYTFTVTFDENSGNDCVNMSVEDDATIEQGEMTTGAVTESSYALSGLTASTFYTVYVQAVKDNKTSEWSSIHFTTLNEGELYLYDDQDNSTIIAANNGGKFNVTLKDRTLYRDGKWNTLCLPFAIDDFTGTPLEGATVKELNATTSNLNNGTLTLNFSDNLTAIEAGTPYIVKWAKADGYDEADPETRDVKNPVFTGVTISGTEPTPVTFTGGSFVGQYSLFSIVANDAVLGENQGYLNEIIMLGSGNKLGYSQNPRTLHSFRAHFYVPAVAGAPAMNSFVMNFGDESTSLREISNEKLVISNYDYYTLDGRKLNGKPTQKSVYVNNGKKIVIK